MMRDLPASPVMSEECSTLESQALAHGQCQQPADPVLCNHCGRTAANGLSCIGACVADSGY